ncbi:MAG: glycosyltransferase family 2 protein [Bacteroidota bacterium]
MEDRKPKISLLIYTYNRAHLIEESIHSVLNQSYRDFELVLVNNGSTDNTRQVLDKYAEHEKVRVIHVEKNLGSAGGMNFAFDNIGGEWFAQMGDDDLLLPNCFERMMRVLTEVDPTVTAITCNAMSSIDRSLTGTGFDHDQYMPLEKIILQGNGDFFAITRTELLGEKRLNPELPGDANVLWYQIDAIANRYYIHEALMIYNDAIGANESTVHSSVNAGIRIKRYQELLKEDFYWEVMKQYNLKQYHARCLRGMYFMRAAGNMDAMNRYKAMLLSSGPGLKSRIFASCILAIPSSFLSKLYEFSGKSVFSEGLFRIFFKKHSLIGQSA